MPWTLDGAPIRVDGWTANCSLGGYDQFRGTCPEADFRRVPGATQGSVIAGYTSDGTPIYYGFLSSPPQIVNGLVTLAAQGPQFKARKKSDRLCVRNDDLSQWVALDADPLSGTALDLHRKIQVAAGSGRLTYTLNDGEAFTGVDAHTRNGLGFWAEGVNIKGVVFDMNYSTVDNDAQFEVDRGDGPNYSTTTTEGTYVCSAGNQGATKTTTFGTTKDSALIYLRYTTNTTVGGTERFRLNNVKVYSTVNNIDDTFNAWELLSYIGGQLGWDTGGVATSTLNILPFDHTDDWGANCDYVAELEDRWWRVLDDRGAGPYMESDLWANSRNWTVSGLSSARDLVPLPLSDKVVVHWTTPGGVTRQKSSTSTTISVGNAFHYTLEDRQGDATLAGHVADALLARFSVPRYQGTIDVIPSAQVPDPYLIRYGDTVTVTDWGPGESITLRILDAQYSPTGVRLGVEQPVDIAAQIQELVRREHRRNRKAR